MAFFEAYDKENTGSISKKEAIQVIKNIFTAYNLPLDNFKMEFRNFYAKFKKSGQNGLNIYDISDFLIKARRKSPMLDDRKSETIEQLKELEFQIQLVKFAEVY